MQQQLKLVHDAITHIAGKNASGVAEVLFGKRDMNEFTIAKKINLTINQTRNILYKLLEAGIVSFTRKKDKDKAWYTYFWTLETIKALEMLEKMMKKEIENHKRQLELRATRRFYICRHCSIEVNEETALLNDFTCTECGNVYELNNDKKLVSEIQNSIARTEKNIAIIREEIQKIKATPEKEQKKKTQKKRKVKKGKKKKSGA